MNDCIDYSIKIMDERINYDDLESYRKETLRKIKLILALDLIVFIPIDIWVVLSSLLYRDEFVFNLFLSINMLNLVIITYYLSYVTKYYRKKFRRKSLPKLFSGFSEENRHEYESFLETSINHTKLYNRIDQIASKNIITGNMNEVSITRADVKIGNITFFSNRRRKYVPLCHGHWYIVDVNEEFEGITHIKQRNKNYIFKTYEQPKVDDSPFDEVDIDDQTFEKQFEVFSTKCGEAKSRLTEPLRKYIYALNQRYPGRIIIAFVNKQVHIGIHHYKKRFKAPIFKKVSKETLEGQIEDLRILNNLIEELNN